MNLNLAIDTSNFKPYDWSLPMLIVHDYRDTYRRYQDMIDKIAEEDGLYILPDTPENELYRATMAKYNTDKEAAMESFSRGMNVENARLLNNIRRRHFSEILPINKAIEAYNKDVDKIAALGPNVTVANRNNRKISDYYGGINPGIQYRDRKTIQQTAAGVVQGINNALMSAPEIAGTIANQYFELKLKGIEGKDALNAILNLNTNLKTEQGISDVSELIQALNTVYNNFAFDEGTPENNEILGDVVTGAIQGIQAPKYDLLADHSYLNDYQKAAQVALELENKTKYVKNPDGSYSLNPDYVTKSLNKPTKKTKRTEKFHPIGKTTEGDLNVSDGSIVATQILRNQLPEALKVSYPENGIYEIYKYTRKNRDGSTTDLGYKVITTESTENIGSDGNEEGDL